MARARAAKSPSRTVVSRGEDSASWRTSSSVRTLETAASGSRARTWARTCSATVRGSTIVRTKSEDEKPGNCRKGR